MATPLIIRRFRKELREREDIAVNSTVTLCDDPARKANTQAATLLLQEVFHGRITIRTSPDGLVCGSREEAAILRLQAYTRTNPVRYDMLLTHIPVQDIEEYLVSKGISSQVYIPSSPEQEFVFSLAEQFSDVVYGL
ncbi:MAG: hypothetical protein ACMXYD_03155 [Candidatus Woesearchaeota archaeon]